MSKNYNNANAFAERAIQLGNLARRAMNLDYISPINEMLSVQNSITYMLQTMTKQIDSLSVRNLFLTDSINKMLRSITPSPDYISSTVKNMTKVMENINYTTTVNTCINEIMNSHIDLSNFLLPIEFDSEPLKEEIEKFSEEDKEETISSVKEIINIVQNKELNSEQLICEKISKLKKIRPISVFIIGQILSTILGMIIESYFTKEANQYYIGNYIENQNITIEIEDKNEDFINNARYINAEQLNVRKGPNKRYDVITILNYGTVVKVINKVKYWTEIEFINKTDNSKINGWVYSRYLEKFNIDLLYDEKIGNNV